MTQQPSRCCIVEYKLTAQDAERINRRRTSGESIASRIAAEMWPEGAQAHIGSPVAQGDVFPAIIVRVFPDEHGPGAPGVNAQVLLDGNDTLWILSAREGTENGTWNWPPRV